MSLTSKGEKLALKVIRKHRLWETFLHQTLNLSLHEIHQEAENLEHFTSDFLAERIDDYLGNPSADPHGDPIPDRNGRLSSDGNSLVLSKAPAGSRYKISRLFGSNEDFFHFCNTNHLHIVAVLKVEKQMHNNKMTEILVNDRVIVLNSQYADIIYVEEI